MILMHNIIAQEKEIFAKLGPTRPIINKRFDI